MKAYYYWKLFSFLRVKKFIVDHPDEISAITDMAGDVTNLDISVSKILAAEMIQTADNTGVTVDVNQKKKLMAETVIQYAHKGLPKAKAAHRPDLIKKLKHEVGYIFRAKKADALTRANEIKAILSDNIVFPNIKPADITAMVDAIKAYNLAQVNPADVRTVKKVEGTSAVAEATKLADDAVENIYDYFLGEYKITKPALVTELAEAIGLEIEGVRHTRFVVMCKDANPPQGAITNLLEGVMVKIVELNREAVSDINGMADISKFKAGTYHVEFSKVGFVTKQMIITFKQGKTQEIEVQMERISA
ncbi:MAG: carboxypeptidase-like regulatory domain-containing protein [Bacteroidota bacterium]